MSSFAANYGDETMDAAASVAKVGSAASSSLAGRPPGVLSSDRRRNLPRDLPDVIARCRRQEAAAWRELYDGHLDRVSRFLARMGVPPGDIEDVVQEVFVVLLRRIHEFDGRVAFSTWMLGIALRLALNNRRRRWRSSAARVLSLMVGASPRDDADPERQLVRKETARSIDAILARMSDRKRAVLVLYELEGLEGPAIAELLGCSVHTVWSRLRHARLEFLRLQRQQELLHGEKVK